MIYDRLPVALVSYLTSEPSTSTNAGIARYLLEHAGTDEELSVKSLAAACHVGTGTVSRFAKDAGFESFAELREAFCGASSSFTTVGGTTLRQRSTAYAQAIAESLVRTCSSLDETALLRLVADLHEFDEIGVYGLLKAQAAATDLTVDLLMQGKLADTTVSPAEQARRIQEAGPDKLIVTFSYTGTYFDGVAIAETLRRQDQPKIWIVGSTPARRVPFRADYLLFASDHGQLAHPFQLEYVAGIIAQEYAAARSR